MGDQFQDQTPRSAGELHAWIEARLGVKIPRAALIGGHSAPFDYLLWSFFEGEPPIKDPRAQARGDAGAAPGQDPELAFRAPARTPDTTPDCVLWANRGGGKTFLGALATALDLIFKPGIEVRILAGSLEQASRMHEHLRASFERPGLAELVRGRITARRLSLENGSRAMILAQSHTSVRGTRVQKIRCDEVELFDREVWEAAQLATRSKQCGRFHVRGSIECLSTMHVPHGIMSRLVEEARAGKRSLFRWGVVDTLAECGEEHQCRAGMSDVGCGMSDVEVAEQPPPPSLVSLPLHPTSAIPHPTPTACPLLPECSSVAKNQQRDPGHIAIADAISMKRRVAESIWASEMLCLRPSRAHAVLPEFDRAVHVVKALPWEATPLGVQNSARGTLTHLCGVDFGYRAPTVILWAALDGLDTLWIIAERSVSGCLFSEHLEALEKSPWPAPQWIGADPAGSQAESQSGQSNIDLLRRAGHRVRARRLLIQPSLELVRARLRPAAGSSPRLYIHARCAALIKSLEQYHYDSARPEASDPVKDGSDHAVDALRYLVGNLDQPQRCGMAHYS